VVQVKDAAADRRGGPVVITETELLITIAESVLSHASPAIAMSHTSTRRQFTPRIR
jgi:hypothetical protein